MLRSDPFSSLTELVASGDLFKDASSYLDAYKVCVYGVRVWCTPSVPPHLHVYDLNFFLKIKDNMMCGTKETHGPRQ